MYRSAITTISSLF